LSLTPEAGPGSRAPGPAAGRNRKQRIRIGTAGWSYDHWVGPFYPAGLPARARLAYYARHLDSAEVNSAFYRLPSESTLEAWRETVPGDFRFAVKASRYITHMKKLKDPRGSLRTFLERIGLLRDRLGPVLFQLPPRWRFDAGRLEAFLADLGTGQRCAFELRDPSWINERTLALLARVNAAFCIYELDGFRSPAHVTADFVYVRLHGPDGAYRGSYDPETLSGWAAAVSAWCADGLDVYCYFDNDEAGHAVGNAMTLRSMLAGGPVQTPGEDPVAPTSL
jgi:uncharacterized protein YecE (DUF72 family)